MNLTIKTKLEVYEANFIMEDDDLEIVKPEQTSVAKSEVIVTESPKVSKGATPVVEEISLFAPLIEEAAVTADEEEPEGIAFRLTVKHVQTEAVDPMIGLKDVSPYDLTKRRGCDISLGPLHFGERYLINGFQKSNTTIISINTDNQKN